MATLTNTKIKDTYVGLLKTTDNQAIDASGVTLVEDGAGNASALSVGRSGNGVSISGNLAVDTDTLYVNTSLSRVGINTNSPTQRLHIKEDDATATYARVSNSAGVLEVGVDASGNGEIGMVTADALLFNTSGSERMRIDSSGLVGIGESDPSGYWSQSNKLVLTSANTGITIKSATTGNGRIVFTDTKSITAGLSDGGMIHYDHNSDSMQLHANGAERMRIDSSGNVGIGVTSARSILETDGTISIFDSRTSVTTGDTLAGIEIYTDDVSYNPPSARANMPVNRILPVVETSAGDAFGMAFYTADTDADSVERMRINSSGRVLIGTIGIPDGTSFYGSAFQPSTNDRVMLKMAQSTTANNNLVFFYNPNGLVGSISTSGSSTIYATSSDYRLKENVVEMTGALDRVDALKPSRFNFIADPNTTVDGFLAHEVQAIVPEAVTGEKDGMRDEEYEVSPAVYEDVVHPAVEAVYETIEHPAIPEEVDEEGNVIVAGQEAYTEQVLVSEAKEEWTERVLVSEAVMGTRSVPDYQGIDQSKIVPLLVGAIKELKAEIEALKAQINA